MRRTWVKAVLKLAKRYLVAVAAHNLGRILRKLFGIGKPKALQGEGGLAAIVYLLLVGWGGDGSGSLRLQPRRPGVAARPAV